MGCYPYCQLRYYIVIRVSHYRKAYIPIVKCNQTFYYNTKVYNSEESSKRFAAFCRHENYTKLQPVNSSDVDFNELTQKEKVKTAASIAACLLNNIEIIEHSMMVNG